MKYLNTYNESLEEFFREVSIPTMWEDTLFYEGVKVLNTINIEIRVKIFKQYLKEVFKNKIVEFQCDISTDNSQCRTALEDPNTHFTKFVGVFHKGLIKDIRFVHGNKIEECPFVGFVVEGIGKWLHGVNESVPIKVFGKHKPGKIEQTVISEREGEKFGI